MLTVITQSVSNASFAIHFPKYIGTFYELLSAPISALEVELAYVGAAVTKFLAPMIMVHYGWTMVANLWALGLVVMAAVFWFMTTDDPDLAARDWAGLGTAGLQQFDPAMLRTTGFLPSEAIGVLGAVGGIKELLRGAGGLAAEKPAAPRIPGPFTGPEEK